MIFTSWLHIENVHVITKELDAAIQIVSLDTDSKTRTFAGEELKHMDEKEFPVHIQKIEAEEIKKEEPFKNRNFLFYESLVRTGNFFIENDVILLEQADVKTDDIAAMILVKGSTFAMLTHKGLLANAYGSIDLYKCGGEYVNRGEKWLANVPFHHTYPVLTGFIVPFISQGTVVIQTEFRMEDFVRTIEEEKIDYLPTVPILVENLFKFLKSKKIKLEHLKFIISGGAPLHRKIIDGMADLGVPVLQGYGLTEYTPIVSANRPGNNRPGSVGATILNVEVRIDSPDGNGNGELLVKGPSMMKGYYKDPALTATVIDEEGWLHTGDIAKIDEAGDIYITGRIRRIVVNKGGKNIYIEEIEKELLKNDTISQIVITPRIDERMGEYAHAVICPDFNAVALLEKEKGRRLSEDEIRELMKTAISDMVAGSANYNKIREFEISYTPIDENGLRSKPFMFHDYYIRSSGNQTCDAGERINAVNMTDSEKMSCLLQEIERLLLEKAAACFGMEKERIHPEADLSEYGFDSISLLAFTDEINETYGIDLTPFDFLEHSTVKASALHIFTEYREHVMRFYFQAPEKETEQIDLPSYAGETGKTENEPNRIKPFTQKEGTAWFMGIDAGSTTIKTVIIDDHGHIRHSTYTRSRPGKGIPVKCTGHCERCGRCSLGSLKNIVTGALSEMDLTLADLSGIIVTGSQVTEETRLRIPFDAHVSEVTAHVTGARHLYPDCEAILDVGGQDSKAMIFDSGLGIWQSKMSGICAAGTGAFLDNVAAKLGITVESMEEIADYDSSLDFSSVCAVFAATSINKYKNRYPLSELIGGACVAQARTVMSGVGEIFRNYSGKILFQGGVAANKVVAHYLQQITGNEIIVPANYKVMGAFGAALLARKHADIKGDLSTESFFTEDDMKKKSITMRSHMVIKDFFGNKEKPLVWRNLFYPVEILNALDCRVFTLESRAALVAQNRKETKKALDKAMYKGYGAETCSFLRVLEGMDLPEPYAGVSTSQPCQQGERILRDLIISNGKADSFYSLNTPIDSGPGAIKELAVDIERSVHCLEKSLGRKIDFGKLEEVFDYSNQAREIAIENNGLRYTSPPLIPGRASINFANILSQGWGTQEFVNIQKQLRSDLLERKHALEGNVGIEDTHRLMWLHLSPFYSTELMTFIENTCNAPIIMEEVNLVRWSPLDIKDPYISLSRKIIEAGFLNMEARIQGVVEELRKSRANGCILYNHMFGRCSMSDITVMRYLKSALNEIGIPLLVLDGDCIDPTIDPCSTYTKVQAYVESLNETKFNNNFGVTIQQEDSLCRTGCAGCRGKVA